MRLLFCSGSPPHYMAPPRLADEQVNCGPFFPDEDIAGKRVSVRTPAGEYDLRKALVKLPAEDQPDAVACLVDSSRISMPRNVGAFRGPKILLVADTHHLRRPILGMLEYLAAERFDRVVFLYTRHHMGIFRASGFHNLFWFPGLTFPHCDETVARARREERDPRLALVGQAGALHARRLRLAGLLAREGVAVRLAGLPQAEAPAYYGSSLAGLNVSLNGDLNLRCFEIVSSGAALLTDRLSPESGLDLLWRDGEEMLSYGSPGELVEKARHLLARPAEARAVGAAGARWFDRHFGEKRRRSAFEALVADGRPVPEFGDPEPGKAGAAGVPAPGLVEAYEEVQALHGREESVQVSLGSGSPAAAESIFRTLPRALISRRPEGEAPPAGLRPMPGGGDIWAGGSGEAPRQASGPAARARLLLQSGDGGAALEAARKAIAEAPGEAEPYLVIGELAQETGKDDLARRMFEQARRRDPGDPRIALLEAETGTPEARTRASRRWTARAWRALDSGEWLEANRMGVLAAKADPASAEAHLVEGLGAVAAARRSGAWMIHGRGLQAIREASRLAPDRADIALRLGVVLRDAGGTMPEAAPAYGRAIELDPSNAAAWFGLGEVRMRLGQPPEAERCFRECLARAPSDRRARLWLGHSLKHQGRIREAHAAYAAALGGPVGKREGAARGGRRRAVFVAQNTHSWPCLASVHGAFAADPSWETVVVALPWVHPSYEASGRGGDKDRIFAFLEEQGVPHVRWEKFPLRERDADLVFLQSPYDVTMPEGWRVADLVRSGHRLCYVPYALEFGGGAEDVLHQFNLPLQQHAWAVCARSEAHRALFAEHCEAGASHVIVSGHPKFDSLCREMSVAPDPGLVAFAAGRPLVLWNPHFDVRLDGSLWGNGYSTFLRWGRFLLEEFSRRPGLAFVVRPHPIFLAALEQRGIMTRGELDSFAARCGSIPNVRLDASAAYYPVLAAADALVSDASSLMLEFGVTGKPVCYLHNPRGPVAHPDYELDLDYIREHQAWAGDEDGIRAFLDRVEKGMDEGAGERAAELRRRMGVRPGGSGPAFKLELERRLAAELPSPATAAA